MIVSPQAAAAGNVEYSNHKRNEENDNDQDEDNKQDQKRNYNRENGVFVVHMKYHASVVECRHVSCRCKAENNRELFVTDSLIIFAQSSTSK
jgi:hypothetical protein